MRKKITIAAIISGFFGACFAFADAWRTANQFDEAGVRLGYGATHSTWLWRHCGVIGFALIALAFFLEFIAAFLPHCPNKDASQKTD